MSRLTKYVGHKDGTPVYKTRSSAAWELLYTGVVNALGRYEEAEGKGQLILLPCPPGQIVYFVKHSCDGIMCHRECSAYGKCDVQGWHIEEWESSELFWAKNRHVLGKRVFLSHAEATRRMKKLQKGVVK